MNVWKNVSNPYIGSTRIAAGNAQLIAVEVLVSKLLRKVLGMSNRSFAYLTAVHGLSLPLIGGLQAPISDPKGYGPRPNLEVLQAAFGTVPAVWAAEFIANTAGVGFHIPRPGIRDALISAASKMLSKPLIGLSINTILPTAVRANFEEANQLEMAYNVASNLRRKASSQ
jgi:hypothetical protein